MFFFRFLIEIFDTFCQYASHKQPSSGRCSCSCDTWLYFLSTVFWSCLIPFSCLVAWFNPKGSEIRIYRNVLQKMRIWIVFSLFELVKKGQWFFCFAHTTYVIHWYMYIFWICRIYFVSYFVNIFFLRHFSFCFSFIGSASF